MKTIKNIFVGEDYTCIWITFTDGTKLDFGWFDFIENRTQDVIDFKIEYQELAGIEYGCGVEATDVHYKFLIYEHNLLTNHTTTKTFCIPKASYDIDLLKTNLEAINVRSDAIKELLWRTEIQMKHPDSENYKRALSRSLSKGIYRLQQMQKQSAMDVYIKYKNPFKLSDEHHAKLNNEN